MQASSAMADAHAHDAHAHDAHGHEDQGIEHQREHLKHEVHHYAHILSEQGPMNITFVHNNTLLGLQHLHFEQAVVEAEHVLGSKGYEPIENFRRYHREGRIADKQIDRALEDRHDTFDLDGAAAQVGGVPVLRRAILRAHMVHGVDALSPEALRLAEQDGALQQPQADLPQAMRQKLRLAAETQLRSDLANLGRSHTLAGWVGGLLGLDLEGAARAQALAGESSGANAEAVLAALGIPAAARTGYLSLLDRKLGDAASPETRAAMLACEADLVQEVARRHWGVDGKVAALEHFFAEHPERFAVLGLWQAALAQAGLDDPLGVSDPVSLEGIEPELDAAERIGQLVRVAQDDGGALPILLPSKLMQQLGAVLDHLEHAPQAGADVHELVEAVRSHLGDRHLGARGVEALQQLAARTKDASLSAVTADILSRQPAPRRQAQVSAWLAEDLAAFHHGRTHLAWLGSLSGEDLIERVNHYMVRVCSAFMDEGLAAWRMPERHLGFFTAWRRHALVDQGFDLEGLGHAWRSELEALPERADDAVIALLGKLGVPQAAWGEYLGRSLAELKGWAGLTFWYETHPKHYKQAVQPTDTLQYLAVRLFVSWAIVRQLSAEHWSVGPDLESLRRHFEIHGDEYFVRKALYGHQLTDAWAERARQALRRGAKDLIAMVADAAWLHREQNQGLAQAGQTAWRLFRLAQLLGWSGAELAALSDTERGAVLQALDDFPSAKQSPVWLVAYERHYRDEILNALSQNRGRGRWAQGRTRRPRSQLVLCIDEREENIHRHYGELDPDHETLGAAGFFGVAQSFTALDDHLPTPLCPAVATPAHRILEIPRNDALHAEYPVHKRRHKWMEVLGGAMWEIKRNLAGSFFLVQLSGLFMAVPLVGRVFAPRAFAGFSGSMRDAIVPPVRTRVTHVRMDDKQVKALDLHTDGLPVGFAIPEATDRVEAQLRNWGLTYQFARIVVICAHRSYSVNNPHENAHDCGACGGKPGGHNSRLFAALANDPQVRTALRERGIDIPDDTWFVGAEHNTCTSRILSYDTQDIPASLRADWQLVSADLEEARRRGARERCRRFGSAPKDDTLEVSARHVEVRSEDLSQVRPEWGHCTNAFAVVGRRCVTQGIFLDRRGFIISYDPTQDADGKILERILLAVGPVGAGINLEYYFSTVDPDSYGCGTKVPHNVTGMVGVMAGAHGDLQTGLPRQMTEVHEAMRLQLIVDAPMAILGEIYGRQAGIRQLLDNQWVHLIAHDPATGEFNMFVPGVGFVKWDEPLVPLPEVKDSYEWFKGKYECFLPPARIAEPTTRWKSPSQVH